MPEARAVLHDSGPQLVSLGIKCIAHFFVPGVWSLTTRSPEQIVSMPCTPYSLLAGLKSVKRQSSPSQDIRVSGELGQGAIDNRRWIDLLLITVDVHNQDVVGVLLPYTVLVFQSHKCIKSEACTGPHQEANCVVVIGWLKDVSQRFTTISHGAVSRSR